MVSSEHSETVRKTSQSDSRRSSVTTSVTTVRAELRACASTVPTALLSVDCVVAIGSERNHALRCSKHRSDFLKSRNRPIARVFLYWTLYLQHHKTFAIGKQIAGYDAGQANRHGSGYPRAVCGHGGPFSDSSGDCGCVRPHPSVGAQPVTGTPRGRPS